MKGKLLLLIFCCFTIQSGIGQPVVVFTPVINSGLNNPVDVVVPNDGTNRIFIVQQNGTIKVFDASYNVLNNNFLTINTNITTGGERGLLSMAFHPNFSVNRFFYTYYTNAAGGINIDRFTTTVANPNLADASSRTNVITINKTVPYANHNGGKLNFGPDGYLYFGLGDAGSGSDPHNFAQRGDSLWGKMVRIQVSDLASPPYYTIPASNPYIADPLVLDEIFCFGLRNPWRWSFDRLTGNMWMADVGQGDWEEVNQLTPVQTNGANFGWRCYEGSHLYIPAGCLPAPNYTFPIFEYPHNLPNGGFSITGGYVYRGTNYPPLYGYYICADFVSGNVWTINSTTNTVSIQNNLLNGITGFGEKENGDLLAITQNGILYTVTATAVLPVTISQWNGFARPAYDMLYWRTENEYGVQSYTLEIATAGLPFQTAAIIQAKNSPSNFYSHAQYSNQTDVLYRLKINYQNGQVIYSGVLKIQRKKDLQKLVFPVMEKPGLFLLAIPADKTVHWEIFSITGQLLLQKKNYKPNEIINLNQLIKGVYLIKVHINEQVYAERILL